MKESTNRVIAAVAGLLTGIPFLILLLHRPQAAGWVIDPWMLAGVLASFPGLFVGVALSGNNQTGKMLLSFAVNWLFYGMICYAILLPFRRRS